MRLLFASDSFKGSLTSEQTIELLTKAANEVFDDPETLGVPVADGGEGTTDAVVAAVGGSLRPVLAQGPRGDEMTTSYGVLDEHRAGTDRSRRIWIVYSFLVWYRVYFA